MASRKALDVESRHSNGGGAPHGRNPRGSLSQNAETRMIAGRAEYTTDERNVAKTRVRCGSREDFVTQ